MGHTILIILTIAVLEGLLSADNALVFAVLDLAETARLAHTLAGYVTGLVWWQACFVGSETPRTG